ncbi:MAG: acylphosphatase [Gemmatimonadetes bacterium]|nr:acylphosphatase [Gemmatimonadota bacterium]
MSSASETVHLIVTGRVQGVGYRWFVVRSAAALGMAGWVRNVADGAVEVAARGTREQVAQLLRALWQGPPRAEVLAVNSKDDLDPDVVLPDPFEVSE